MAKLRAENLRTHLCKGCGYCVESCPRKAVTMGDEPNKLGYCFIQFDESKCISCGICRTVCPDNVFVFTEN